MLSCNKCNFMVLISWVSARIWGHGSSLHLFDRIIFFFYHAIEMLNPIFTLRFREDAIRLYIYDLSLACQFFLTVKNKIFRHLILQ